MPDRDHPLNDEASPLALALRALPGAVPQPDAWPALARELERRRTPARRRHRHAAWLVPAAIAAAFAWALLLPRTAPVAHGPAGAPIAATDAAASGDDGTSAARAELSQLRERSQSLERWIAAVSAHAAQDSRGLMAAVEMQDLIGLVDVQLNATRDPADALPLWRQRIALLEELAVIRGSGIAIAANIEGTMAGEPSLLLN
jgi:hypothetical protein